MGAVPKNSFFVNRDGQKLNYWCADNTNNTHLLILLHGHGEHIGRYQKFKDALVELPLDIATYDMRGYGQSEGEEVYVESLEDLIGDVTDFYLFLKNEKKIDKPIILFGHSLGGLIAYYWAKRHPLFIQGLILSSPCLGLNLPLLLRLLNHLVNAINPHFIYKNPVYPPYLTHNLEEVEKYKKDVLIKRKISSRLLSEMIVFADELSAEDTIEFPFGFYVLFAGLEKIVDKTKTRMLYDKVQAPHKGIKEFEGYYHEIFNEQGQGKVFDQFKVYLTSILKDSKSNRFKEVVLKNKILVIDDDPNIVELLKHRLKANGYEIVTASNGEEGLAQVKKENPDLVLVDVLMPKMDGYTFVRTLRKNPETESVPVIVITAKDKMKDLFDLEGIQGYMIKPYQPEELLELVKGYIGKKIDH
jgi:lysophospholipase